ncbi:MAG: (2Fe-2S)-binding protein [Deltaproteobacteria bacterium]|nr:(2Fe-2S)-binding protein [Deltaproteobacteria bacterium]
MDKFTLTIDGREITTTADKSLLEAALEGGIYIPHMCFHEDLRPEGACRLCLVEIEGVEGVKASCSTKAEKGMVVTTKSEHLEHLRHLAMELIIARHPAECTGCPKYLNCELQSNKQFIGGSEEVRVRKQIKPISVNDSNPLFTHDFTRCILCGRCVRACYELRGVGVVSFIGKGKDTNIGTAYDRLLMDADCRFCGACAAVCPTGSIRDSERYMEGKDKRKALLPCKNYCPVGIDVPRYVRLIAEGKFDESYAVVRESLPLPCICSYVCLSFCENDCRRGQINDPVGIRELKRFVSERHTDFWKRDLKPHEPTGKRVAVLGSGPSGLTAAYYLARKGHGVTIFEQDAQIGGMLRHTISRKRLPKEALEDDINEIINAGVEIRLNEGGKTIDQLFEEGYNAVLLAIGSTFSGPPALRFKDEDLNITPMGGIEVDTYNMATSREGVFACGDVAINGVTEDFIEYTKSEDYYEDFHESLIEGMVANRGDSYRSATIAIKSGKNAAEGIDQFLDGDGDLTERFASIEEEQSPILGREKGFSRLGRRADAFQRPVPQYAGMDPAGDALTEEEAVEEAKRCLKCNLRLKITPPKFWTEY